MTPQDARRLGFIKGAGVEVAGRTRVMTGRIQKDGETLIAMGTSPFILYAKGEFKARLLTNKIKP